MGRLFISSHWSPLVSWNGTNKHTGTVQYSWFHGSARYFSD
ncbi:hypothetical protein T11_11697, partial [Trichinella zimbabwensis]